MNNIKNNTTNAECSILHKEVVSRVLTNFPDEHNFEVASSFFKVLGDPTRTKIIWCLDQNEMCVCDIAATLGMTKSAISHQLAKLKAVNMVTSRRNGKEVFYSLTDDHVKHMLEAGMEHSLE